MKIKAGPKGLRDIRGLPPVDRRAERLVGPALIRDGDVLKGRAGQGHADLRARLGDTDPYQSNRTDAEGFWTNRDRFVSRYEAKQIAVKSGQLPASWSRVEREVLSSDITW